MEIMTKLKQLKDFATKRKYPVLLFSFVCFFLDVLGENLRHYGLVTHKLEPHWTKDVGAMFDWMIVFFFMSFPCGICFATRKWLLSEKWILLFLEALILALKEKVIIQNPYIDPPFAGMPLYRFLYDLGSTFCIAVFLQGLILISMHFSTRDKNAVHTLRRIILSNTGAILLTVLMFGLDVYLGRKLC